MKILSILILSSVLTSSITGISHSSYMINAHDDFIEASPHQVQSINVLSNDIFHQGEILKGNIQILNMPSKGVAIVDNNETPDLLSDDLIWYSPIGSSIGLDEIQYIIQVENSIVDTALISISITI